MTADAFRALVAPNRESESLEVKAGGPRSDQFLAARVIRAALGLANHEGGGWIVIGIEEDVDGSFRFTGIPEAHLPTWNHDDVSAAINGSADPHVTIEVEQVQQDGNTFVVIRVQEFVDIPVRCTRTGPTPQGGRSPILRKDTCYARSRRKPETVEALSDSTTWRTLVELAGRKEATRTLKNLNVTVSIQGAPIEPSPTSDEQFERQLGDLR
jgi:hypothetical protein